VLLISMNKQTLGDRIMLGAGSGSIYVPQNGRMKLEISGVILAGKKGFGEEVASDAEKSSTHSLTRGGYFVARVLSSNLY